jgi:hypothetical protein
MLLLRLRIRQDCNLVPAAQLNDIRLGCGNDESHGVGAGAPLQLELREPGAALGELALTYATQVAVYMHSFPATAVRA